MLTALAAVAVLSGAETRACSVTETEALIAPPREGADAIRLRCFATLPPGAGVARRVIIEGEEATGAGIDCRGGSVGRAGAESSTVAPTILIQSRRGADGWSRPTDVRVLNCIIHGNVRIWGLGGEGRIDELRASSRTSGHSRAARAAAPVRITLSGNRFVGTGSIPLYVGPGVAGVTIRGGAFEGRSVSTAVYLDAESGDNVIQGVRFDIRTGREQIAVDGSAGNVVQANRFILRGRGGVFLYRNCGEDGVIRHQTPSGNRIVDNEFHDAAWLWPRAVVVGAREGRRRYCGDDAGFPFGSSVDDGDRATGNVVAGNTVRFRWLPAWLQAGRGAVRTP